MSHFVCNTCLAVRCRSSIIDRSLNVLLRSPVHRKGGGLGTQAVLIVGVSTIVADGLSMGLGEYLSSKAMNEYMDIERKREEWELANHRQARVGC